MTANSDPATGIERPAAPAAPASLAASRGQRENRVRCGCSYHPDKPADYLATIDLRVAGQWREKTWQARLSAIDSTPAAPGGFTASYVSATQIDLSWTDQSPIESCYLIEQSANGGQSWTALPPRPANSTSYSATGPFGPGIAYQFRLRAADAFGRSSAPVTCLVATPPLPAIPSDLVIPFFTAEGTYLYWTDNSDDETGFVVEWTDGTTTQSTTVGADVSDCYVPGPFAASTTYTFRVAAQNASGLSASVSQPLTSPAAPAAPSSLVLTSINSTVLSLSLADNSSDEEGFLAEASTDAGVTWEYLGSAPASEGTGTISVAIGGVFAPNTAHQFRVRAYNDFTESGPTNTVSATTADYPLPCTGLSMTSATLGSISLAWSNPGNQTALALHRSEDYDFATYDAIALGSTDTSLTDSGLSAGTVYYYRLIAANAAGDSAPAYLDAGTLLADPAAPSATAVSAWRIDLDWADAGSALDYYEIHRSTEDDFTPSSETLIGTSHSSDWTDCGLAPAGTYYYRVIAVDVFERSTLASPDTAASALAAPTASAPASVAEGTSFTLTLDAGPNTLDGWTVWWGDGQVEDLLTGSGTLTHSCIGQSRTISVYARAYDEDGAHDLPAAEIALTNLVPTAGISGSSTGTEGGVFVLGLSASDPGSDPITSWQINWGDGMSQTIYGNPSALSHIYADDGEYTISATATDIDGGSSSSVSHPVSITDVPATFSFRAAGPIGPDGWYTLYITHADAGSDPVTSYSIDWGDGTQPESFTNTGPTTSADHDYANPAGSYTVAVTAVDAEHSSGQSAGSASTSATPVAAEEYFMVYLEYPSSAQGELSIKDGYDPYTHPAVYNIRAFSWTRQYVLAGDERAAVMEALEVSGLGMQLSAMEWMGYPNYCYRGGVTVEGNAGAWIVAAYPEFGQFGPYDDVTEEGSSTWFEVYRDWDYQWTEGGVAMGTHALEVTLDIGGSAEHGGTKDYRLKDADGNYVEVSNGQATVTIPEGDYRVRLYVEPVNDSTPEWTEDIFFTFADEQPFRTWAGRERKTVYIMDNDVDIILAPRPKLANTDDDNGNGVIDRDDEFSYGGENDLYPVQLDFPPDLYGAEITLTVSAGTATVWDSPNKGVELAGPRTGGQAKWKMGSSATVPRTVWLEVTHGSTSMAGVWLTLATDQTPAREPTPRPTSRTITTTRPAIEAQLVKSVEFSGTGPGMFQTIIRDGHVDANGNPITTGNALYDAPHWYDDNDDGDADDWQTGDRRYPISYTRSGIDGKNVFARVDATLKVIGPDATNLLVRSTERYGPHSDPIVVFPPTAATLQNGLASATINGTTPMPNTIDKSNWYLVWEVSLDGGATWLVTGVTQNTRYVTNVALSAAPVLTVIDIGCRSARGETDLVKVQNDIWSEFASPATGVLRADGHRMTYWGSAAQPRAIHTYAGLIQHADGRCQAWATLLEAVFRTQGVSAQAKGIEAKKNQSLFVEAALTGQGNITYPEEIGTEPSKQPFDGHAVVLIGDNQTLFDPSYGTRFDANNRSVLLQWEDAAIDKYVFKSTHVRVNDEKGKLEVEIVPLK